MIRIASILVLCLAMANCAPIGRGGGSGDARLEEACRQAADRAYETQHRAEIFRPMSGVNSPQSNNYAAGSDGRGLGRIYERDNDIRDCVRRGGVSANAPAPVPAPVPAPPRAR